MPRNVDVPKPDPPANSLPVGSPQIPAATFIEMALDALQATAPSDLISELHELGVFGSARQSQAFRIIADKLDVNSIDSLDVGYLLGLRTARALSATQPPKA